MPVEVIHWNPRKRVVPGLAGKFVPLKRPVNNFGDLLGPKIVEKILAERGLDPSAGEARLLVVGSILHLAGRGDHVWGAGINGKKDLPNFRDRGLEIHAVRGPLTQRILHEAGIHAPKVFGDPGLLWSHYWPREYYTSTTDKSVGIVPNLNDWKLYANDPRVISPIGEPHDVIEKIAKCEFVVASSLHGIVIAESFGIPARLIPPASEPMHKYIDYYQGTGRDLRPASTLGEALEIGGEVAPAWDKAPLLDAFPAQLWRASKLH